MKKIIIFPMIFFVFGIIIGYEVYNAIEEDGENIHTGTIVAEIKGEKSDSYSGKSFTIYPFGVDRSVFYPFGDDVKRDDSRMTLQRLDADPYFRMWKNSLYFMNALYEESHLIKEGLTGNEYQFEEQIIQEGPSKEPIYFDRTPYQRVRNDEIWSLEHLEGNVLLTGYLETYETSRCVFCDEDEKKEYGNVEVRSISPKDGKYGGFTLGYTEGNFIITDYPNKRFDRIDDVYNNIHLRNIANDGKIHTFGVILDHGGHQERGWNGSMIREWSLIE